MKLTTESLAIMYNKLTPSLIKEYYEKLLKALRFLKYPLITFFLSLALLLIFYDLENEAAQQCQSFIVIVVIPLLSAIASTSLFYLFTISLTNYNKQIIAKDYATEWYKNWKKDIFTTILDFLKKRVRGDVIDQALLDYEKATILITKDDIDYLMNHLNQDLVSEVLYYLRQLDNTLSGLLLYEFAQQNRQLHNRIWFFRNWIKQSEYGCNRVKSA